jgi:hypothetical protein
MAVMSPRSVRLGAALVGVAVITLSFGCGRSRASKGTEEARIGAVVIQDTLAEARPVTWAFPKDVCVARGNFPPGAPEEPSPEFMAVVRSHGVVATPLSGCDTFVVRATGAPAVVIAVGPVEWRGDAFVKVKTARLLGPLAGRGWIYTLSREKGSWVIDTVRNDDWVS